MSAGFTWHLLIPVGRLEGSSLIKIVEQLAIRGLPALRGPGGELWAMNADGSGTVSFSDASRAISWIAKEGGLVAFGRADDIDELSISVHRVDGTLPAELTTFGDTPLFDEVQLDVSRPAARSQGNARRFFNQDALTVGNLCGAVFAWCLDEWRLEALGDLSVHRSIASGRLPFLPGATIAVPHDSAMLPQLKVLAKGAVTLTEIHGWFELRRVRDFPPVQE